VPEFYEFFAGGGMARAGLGPGWTCRFANDFDPRKTAVYALNWGGADLKTGDVAAVTPDELPGRADLTWASFPCQDLSLAGAQAGLKGERSGTFYPFWRLMRRLAAEGRGPRIIALENVCGALTSHGGRDLQAICQAFLDLGYRCGALVIDAALFVPQSRPRLFLIGVAPDVVIPDGLTGDGPCEPFHPAALRRAVAALPSEIAERLTWWATPTPGHRNRAFADLIEDDPDGAAWHTPAQTERLLSLMSPLHRGKLEAAMAEGACRVGAVYRRTRRDPEGRKVQRAEVRFDDVSGCLRTPAGGSSRQQILVVEGRRVRSRLLSPREAARLMGLPDDYRLPEGATEAYHLAGDGVAVDVVRHLARFLFEPLLGLAPEARSAA
jgi:DNA (cytosine-5)-methyltransferase 1